MVFYHKFNCLYENGHIKIISRQLGKRIKEHIPKSIDEFSKLSNNANKSIRVVNASKLPAIAEHLVNNLDCVNNYTCLNKLFYLANIY